MKRNRLCFPMRQIPLDLNLGKPQSQPLSGRVDVGKLGLQALVRIFFQMLDIKRAGGMRDQHDPLQIVHSHQKIELGSR